MRLIALIAAAIVAAAAGDIDPCKRQPFRGRCPSKNGAPPSRSQFVLRYYLRDGECVSYPYGHCLNDDSEPKLFRYKEECEDACVKGPGNLGTPKETVKVVKENTAAPTTAPHAEPTVTPKTEKPTPETEKPTPKTVAPNTEEATEESSASTTEKATTVEASTTSAPRTECERRRAQSGGLIRGGFVPACTPEGQFEKMQCEPSGGQCFCVDDKGIELPNSRTRGLPDCTRILSASAPKSNECVGVPTSGPCSSSMERWYYDESMQLCKAFKYSGCGGNGNNYASEQACKARCAPPPLGAPKCEKGEPLKTVTGAPINCAKRDCPTGYKCSVIQGSSVCCPQNEKSAGALQSGHPSDPCQMQKERGPCDRYELRFYYNAEMKECKYFFYGGCDGNGNNFEKVEDCEVRCNVTKPTRFGGHVTQSLNPTQPAGAQTVTKESTTERPTTQRPTTHSTTSTTVRPTTGPVLSLRPAVAQGPDQTVMESNRCRHPKDAGTCRGQFVRWFFNFELGRCEAFTYTGCAGNGNNFASEEECLTGCAKEGTKNGQVTTAILETDDGEKEVPAVANVCIHDVDAGDCNGVFQRFAFDQESGECRPFTYGGCGGNGNNFAALADCERKCGGAKAPVVVAPTTAPFVPPPVNICEHPVDKGPCNGIFARYAFDPLTSDCQQFTYGGCGGNGNNFASASDCRQVCMKPSTKASHTTATPVVHCPPAPRCQPGCQMARDQHSCIVCNCDRAAHPPAPLPSAPQARPACPLIDMQACVEPCIVFSNRKGCQECVCPVPDPNFQQTVQPHGASIFSSAATVAAAQPPSHRESVAPPSFNTAHPPGFVHPPAPRQQSVKNVESFQKQELQEIEKPLAPLPTNRVEPLRTLPTQDSRSPGQAPPQHLAPHFPREQFSPQVPQTHSGPIAPAPVPAQLTEKCMQPVDAGPCSNYVDRWFFNADDGQCHPFKYGGCAGNRNHFFTMRECEIHCARFSHMRPMPSSTDAPSTTSTAPPTTEKSKTANTAPTRQQLPVRPDGAGREPVPLAPVGIGRSMQELNIDQMDGELEQPTEKIFHPTVAPTRAPETPRAEQHNNEHFNTHSLRQDSFSPQVSCTLPPDAGLCKNYVPRWFFNAQTGLCEQFSFGSCGGNANNFMDRANCEFKCRSLHRPTSVLSQVPERCSFEKDTGFGRGYNVKWYFNMKNLRCEQFVYEGKGGNANQFDTLTDCERYCTPQPGSVVVRPAVQLPPLQTPIPQPPAPRQQPPPQPVPVPQPATVNTESRLPQAQAPVISAPGHSSSSAMDSDEALQPEEMEESKEAGGVNTNNNLQEIPDSVHSFENPQAELDKLDAEYDDGPAAPVVASRPPVGSEEVSAIPAFEPRPPAAAHSAKTKNVQAPQPIPNVAADIDDKPKESYKAEPIPAKPAATGNEGLPRVGLTPPETVNYQTGAKPKTHGILNFGEGNAIDTDKFEFPEDSDEPKPPMPTCPNGLQEHRYVDGRAVQCLPGRNQCPDNSECYFNGLDYYCCPNVEDPYDKHVFGGYDGEEEKHGYKAFGPLKIRRLRDQPMSRRKRQSAFNMDDIVLPLRFDDSKPKQFARAGAIMPTRNVRRKQASINKQKEALDVASANVAVCVQELAKGDCSEAHLRYFYDRNSDSCRLFYYSGCKGNENNFGSLEDCQKTCVLGMKQMQVVANANIPTQSATEPPVLPGQCPGGKSPLGGAAPVLCGNNTDSIGCPIGYHCRNGPPDVCCPGQDPAKLSLDLLLAQKSNVRFAPRIDADQFSVTTTEAPHRSFLDVPKFICPDASDPLMGTNGLPLMCGAGFDGMKMCPRGFYCAIDSEKGSRLCCPLLGAGSRLPSQEAQTPYFGRRKANPGEVIDRGTLPADQVEYTRRKEKLAVEQAKPQLPETGPSPSEFEDTENSESAQTSVEAQTAGAQESTEAQSGESSTETASNEEGFAQLKMKPDNNHEKEQKEAAAHNPHVAVVDAESDGVSINTGAEAKSELEDDNVQSKEIVDQSICHLTPSEGRQCRDDEQSPRTNLHYFYSAKDKRCKLYFYRGCGGNANRFEKKAACEERCLTRA